MRRFTILALGFVLCAGSALAQMRPQSNVPKERMPDVMNLSSRSPDLFFDFNSHGWTFVPITPCRVVDTRQATGGPGGPVTTAVMTLQVTGAAYPGVLVGANPCTASSGAPTGSVALALNLTMAGVTGPTDLRAAPQGTPPTSSIMNSSGSNIANAINLSVNSSNGQIDVKSGGANFNLIIDVFGYYLNGYLTAPVYVSSDNTSQYNLSVYNNCQTFLCSSSHTESGGIYGLSASANANTAGVSGVNTYQSPGLGDNASTIYDAVISGGGSWGSAGVYGNGHTGVSGFGDGIGVYGASEGLFSFGVMGDSYNGASPPAVNASGYLGVNFFLASWGVYGNTNLDFNGAFGVAGQCAGTYDSLGSCFGLYSYKDIGASGAKLFVTPDPEDATKVIGYVSLEGNEAGTYFRGKGRIVNGFATIDVPVDFRKVTEEDGLTAVATPVGEMAVLAVVSQDLNKVVVQGSKDVNFNYIVNGIRRGYKDYQVQYNADMAFMPWTPDERLSDGRFTKQVQASLIKNGTFNSDGTVNMATATKMGWDKMWNDHKKEIDAYKRLRKPVSQ